MELGAIFEHIKRLPNQAQNALLSGLKLTNAKNTPAGAVLVAMQILTALGLLRLIDLVLGEEHTSIEYLKQEMAEGRKQVPSSGILIGLLVADMLAYPKRIVRVYEVQKLAKAWHTDKLLGIDPDLLNDDPAEGKIHSANLSQAWSRPLALGFLSRLTCWQEVPMIVQPCLRH